MWQTETGGPVFGNPYGLALLPIKPGSAGHPAARHRGRGRDAGGRELRAGREGHHRHQAAVPRADADAVGRAGALRAATTGQRIPGETSTSPATRRAIDEDGYVWFSGRADEIIKIAAHRIGTIEVETAFLRHPAVAEAGVTGRPDELRGEVISAFVVLKQGHAPSDELQAGAARHGARASSGPVAVIGELNFVDMLPKTRSGKIMRRVLKAVILGQRPRRHLDHRGRGLGRGGARGLAADASECHDGELRPSRPGPRFRARSRTMWRGSSAHLSRARRACTAATRRPRRSE